MPLKGNGKYIITHVKTGKRLSFVRNEVTNLYPVAKGTAVEIQVRFPSEASCGGNSN